MINKYYENYSYNNFGLWLFYQSQIYQPQYEALRPLNLAQMGNNSIINR